MCRHINKLLAKIIDDVIGIVYDISEKVFPFYKNSKMFAKCVVKKIQGADANTKVNK